MKKVTIAIIPARGGSKRLPNKNILSFCGEPLIIRSIKVALESSNIDKVIVTTDSDDILTVISEYNLFENKLMTIKRPDSLATDTATQVDVIEHVVSFLGKECIEKIILLQPTSPLRSALDIDRACDLFTENNCGSVASFGELNHPTKYATTISNSFNVDGFVDELQNLPKRSQEFEKEYILNGAIYIFSTTSFLKEKSVFIKPCLAYLMPYERSFDIDEEIDFKICEHLAKII